MRYIILLSILFFPVTINKGVEYESLLECTKWERLESQTKLGIQDNKVSFCSNFKWKVIEKWEL